jgi:hypothetical protein
MQSLIHELSEKVRQVKERRAPINSKIEAIETLVGDFIRPREGLRRLYAERRSALPAMLSHAPLGAPPLREQPPTVEHAIYLKPPISVKQLADEVGLMPLQIIAELKESDILANINYTIAPDVACKIARKHGCALRKSAESVAQDALLVKAAETAVDHAATLSDALSMLDTRINLSLQTADTLASALRPCPKLDWSPAVIALCKAFEVETVDTILVPLRAKSAGRDLRADLEDKEIGAVAKYCCADTARPPEMGTLARFLQTAIHSKRRRESSKLLQAFYEVLSFWPRSKWIVEKVGLTAVLKRLTTEFRNRAAHIEMMTEAEFANCRRFLRDHPEEIILRLFLATRFR